MRQLETIKKALSKLNGLDSEWRLEDQIAEIIEMNEDPRELTREEWQEKYGCEMDE